MIVFETLNETAVGPFDSRESAERWMAEVVPPSDQMGEGDYPDRGYRVGTREEMYAAMEEPELESPDEARARYAGCYAEYYPHHRAGIKTWPDSYEHAPAHSRWHATLGDYDLDCKVGTGSTPQEAVNNLLEALREVAR